MEIWERKPPGTLWATPGPLLGRFTFYFYVFLVALQLTVLVLCPNVLKQVLHYPEYN
jgi:hypothetical protein